MRRVPGPDHRRADRRPDRRPATGRTGRGTVAPHGAAGPVN